jgi:tetratricopeptide (TPR) repeat protein
MAPRVWTLTVLLCLLAGAARADVVHLHNGSSIRGEVVSEDEWQVVLRTPDGRLVVPRDLVDRIERESTARRLLEEARTAAANRDSQAEQLYERCLAEAQQAGETQVAQEASAELEAWRTRPRDDQPAVEPTSPAPTHSSSHSSSRYPWRGRPDPCVESPEPEAIIRELEAAVRGGNEQVRGQLLNMLYRRAERRAQEHHWALAASDYRRCREHAGAESAAGLTLAEYSCRLHVAEIALRGRDPRLAGRAAEVVAEDDAPAEVRARGLYLVGRSLEVLGRRTEARAAFQASLEASGAPRAAATDPVTLRELARMGSSGVEVDETTPGIAAGWRWETTENFVVLHQLDDAQGRELARRSEEILREVRANLDLTTDDVDMGSIALFVFSAEEGYRGSPGARAWSAGHASRLRTEYEVIRSIWVFPGPNFENTLRHEVAHIVVGDATPDGALLPAWANEGAAISMEGPSSQRYYQRQASALLHSGRLRPLDQAMGQMLPPLSNDTREVSAFYVQAAAMFRVLQAELGADRALDCLEHVNEEGPEAALRREGLSLERFESAFQESLR